MKSKSFLSVIMIIGAVILVIGIVITVIGFTTGGGVRFRDDWWTEVENLNYTASGDVTSLTLKASFGDVEIIAGSGSRVEVKDYPKGVLEISEANGELRIIDKNADGNWLTSAGINVKKTPKITIYLSNSELENLNIEQGAGDIKIKGLSAKTVKHSIGAGTLEVSDFAADNYELEAGAGDITFKNTTIATFKASLGAGDFSFQGDIDKSCKIDGGFGSVDIELAGPESKYKFKCEQGVGSVSINGFSSVGVTNFETSSGDVLIEVSSGAGDVKIKTK